MVRSMAVDPLAVCLCGGGVSVWRGFRWFSESGKLVMKLFEHITELVEDEDSLICVLIDEASAAAMSSE